MDCTLEHMLYCSSSKSATPCSIAPSSFSARVSKSASNAVCWRRLNIDSGGGVASSSFTPPSRDRLNQNMKHAAMPDADCERPIRRLRTAVCSGQTRVVARGGSHAALEHSIECASRLDQSKWRFVSGMVTLLKSIPQWVLAHQN